VLSNGAYIRETYQSDGIARVPGIQMVSQYTSSQGGVTT